MPSGGGPVYKPTTVSYEPRPGHVGSNGPLGFLGPPSALTMDSPLRVFRLHPRLQFGLLLFVVISLMAGILILVGIFTDLLKVRELLKNPPDESVSKCWDTPLGLLLVGVFLTTMGVFALVIYLKIIECSLCGCLTKKQKSLARQLQCENGAGCGQGIMALNPSTDPLVSHTQYAPISELPSLRVEDEERRNLMPDNKDCLSSAEESDRMLEPDPRIVLRPIGRAEDA